MKNIDTSGFRKMLAEQYRLHGRPHLPWRLPEPDGSFDPYKILVSEVMLQQTQVTRAIPKYHQFLESFPNVEALAAASLGDVLVVWSGLGYNRRAKFLWQAAQTLVREYGGVFPRTVDELIRLPGIGRNTAGAVLAYAFNQPVVFIETNIRSVYIHHFFADADVVADKELQPLIGATLDTGAPREFYWAVMDYGSYLKRSAGNHTRRSRHYVRQSKFKGSNRQIRGQVIRLLAQRHMSAAELAELISDDRLEAVLATLMSEGLIVQSKGYYRLA
ncbi:MAG TPA: hypothetical protein VFH39_03895 [Candidatus Saccharimonadales bacterium]|nr:hypothetical protein [Candidatus Saccharimonadales bacterium]